MKRLLSIGAALCLMQGTGPTAEAAPATAEFSAEAVQQVPNQPVRIARMYVARQGVRTEYQQDGQDMVEIYNLAEKRALLLMPNKRMYMEREMPGDMPPNPLANQPSANPCGNNPNLQCKRLGEEQIEGRRAVKWEMSGQQDGRPVRSLHWIDHSRNLPLRQLWSDGTISELRVLGRETLNGRATEKWELVTTRPDGDSRSSYQWYDAELGITIREELPGGYSRELRNIKVAAQPPTLFTQPQGYQRVTVPDPQQGQEPAATQQRPGSMAYPPGPGRQ